MPSVGNQANTAELVHDQCHLLGIELEVQEETDKTLYDGLSRSSLFRNDQSVHESSLPLRRTDGHNLHVAVSVHEHHDFARLPILLELCFDAPPVFDNVQERFVPVSEWPAETENSCQWRCSVVNDTKNSREADTNASFAVNSEVSGGIAFEVEVGALGACTQIPSASPAVRQFGKLELLAAHSLAISQIHYELKFFT